MTQVQSMSTYEMTEQLAQKMHITLEEAKAALEAAEWNTLTATHQLEQERFRRMQALNEAAAEAQAEEAARRQAGAQAEAAEQQAEAQAATAARQQAKAADKAARAVRAEARKARRSAGLKRIGRAVMDLVALGNRSRFAIHRNGAQLLEMPVTVLAVLLLFSFGTCALLLVAGLLAGCRYSVNGRFIGAEA